MSGYTQEKFIQKANEKHNFRYDYSEVKFITTKLKVKIICKLHGAFEQKATNHLQGQNCPSCTNKLKLNREVFIKKAIEKHNNIYTYSSLKWINSKTKVAITCKIHGNFIQMPANHLQGNCCPKCSRELTARTRTEFKNLCIKKAE